MARLAYDPLRLGQLIARVWQDPQMRYRLLTQPRETLAEAGVQVGDTNRIVVHEDTEGTINIVIPRRPPDVMLQDEEYLRSVGRGLLDGCGDGSTPPAER